MAEVLRLQIVYETQRAASALTRLNPIQRETTRGIKTIESGMKSLAVSALGIPGPIGKIAEGLLKFGTGGMVTLTAVAGIALIAGAFKAASEEAAKLGKENDKLAETLGGQFGGERVKLLKDLEASRKALADLQRQAQNFAPNSGSGGFAGFMQRLKAITFGPGMDVKQIQAQTAVATATNLVAQQEAAIAQSLQDQIAAREKALKIQKEQALEEAKVAFLLAGEQDVMIHRNTVNLSRHGDTVSAFDRFHLGGNTAGPRSLDLGFGQRPDAPLRSLDTRFQGANMGLGARPEELLTNELTRQQKRIVDSWSDGLHAMQDAVNEFLVTGKFAIQDLINTFLSIAFRAASEGFIETAVNKTIDKIGHSNAAKPALK